MKKIKKYFSIYLSIFILIISSYKPITARAANSFSASSVNIDGSLIGCYVYSDPSLLPDSMQLYWIQNGRVQHAPYTKFLITALNKEMGLTFKDSWFSDLFSWIEANIFVSSAWLDSFINSGVYLVSNGVGIVGVAIDDLSGYQLTDDNSTSGDITIPSGLNNITYNIVNEYLEYHPETTDIINIETATSSYLKNLTPLNASAAYYDFYNNFADSLDASSYNFFLNLSNSKVFAYNGAYGYTSIPDLSYLVTSDNSFDWLINNFALTKDSYYISLSDFSSMQPLSSYSIRMYFYDNTRNSIDSAVNYIFDEINETVSQNTVSLTDVGIEFSRYYGGIHAFVSNSGSITVYRNSTIPSQITNNTYSQNIYKSNTWNNYNPTSTSNSFTTNYNEMNNSETTNTNIYNQTKETTNNNTSNNNYNYNYENNTNNTTTIINNYYGDSGGDDDDDDDHSIWDALLKALGDFLKKIGELLATILTGIISICTSVLDAIASIAESFTGITDFIASIFAFIPSDIVAVLTLGIMLAVLISLIKIFRG